MPISKIKTSSITADAASVNLNIDANTLFVDVANNRVGIANTAPDLPLDVRGTVGTNGDAYRTMVLLSTNTATANYGGGIAFGGFFNGTSSRTNDFAGIQGFKENGTEGDYAGALRFTTRINGGNPTERMRITSAGNVGIGTTSPTAHLEIGGTNPEIRLGPVSATSGAYMSYNTAGNYFSLNAVTQGVGYRNITFATDGGNVGIGTTGPSSKLQVNNTIGTTYSTTNTLAGGVVAYIKNASTTDSTDATIRLEATGSGSVAATSISAVHTGAGAGALTFGTRASAATDVLERIRIASDGNLLIGTTTSITHSTTGILIGGSSNRGISWSPTSDTHYVRLESSVIDGITINGYSGVAFATGSRSNSTWAERMRIASNGNVAIGTTNTAVAKVNVQLTGATVSGNTTGVAVGAGSIFQLNNTNGGGTNSTVMLLGGGTGDTAGQISSGIGFTRENENDWGTQLRFYTHQSATDVLSTLNERMRIDSAGRLSINSTSNLDSSRLFIQMASNDNAMSIRSFDSITSVMQLQFYNASNGRIGFIQTVSGTSTTFSTSSDYRLKEDITPMTGALAKVVLLKPVTYKWKSNGKDGQGFIAHELQEVVPDCVTGEKDAVDEDGKPVHQGIDTSFLVATLTAAIQEQQAIITQLTDRITALEAK